MYIDWTETRKEQFARWKEDPHMYDIKDIITKINCNKKELKQLSNKIFKTKVKIDCNERNIEECKLDIIMFTELYNTYEERYKLWNETRLQLFNEGQLNEYNVWLCKPPKNYQKLLNFLYLRVLLQY